MTRTPIIAREHSLMFALIAVVLFLVAGVLELVGHASLPEVLVTFGLAAFALASAYPWAPWRRTA